MISPKNLLEQRVLEESLAYSSRSKFLKTSFHPLSYYGVGNPPPGDASLTLKEERALWRRYRRTGDLKAKERLVKQYLCWAFKLANKMKGPRLDVDEAVGVANLGLMQAIESFKPGKNKKFVVYSYMVIRRHLIDALVNTYPVKVSTHVRKWMKAREDDEEAKLRAAATGEPGTLEELFNRLGEAVGPFNLADYYDRPEDCPIVPAPAEAPSDGVSRTALGRELEDALETELTPLERAVIRARHYSDTVDSFENIGARLGEPKNKVREAYNLALVKLRRKLG